MATNIVANFCLPPPYDPQIVGTCLVAGFVLTSVVNGQAGTCPDGSPWNEKLGVDEFGCNVDYCSKVSYLPKILFTAISNTQVRLIATVASSSLTKSSMKGRLFYTDFR